MLTIYTTKGYIVEVGGIEPLTCVSLLQITQPETSRSISFLQMLYRQKTYKRTIVALDENIYRGLIKFYKQQLLY